MFSVSDALTDMLLEHECPIIAPPQGTADFPQLVDAAHLKINDGNCLHPYWDIPHDCEYVLGYPDEYWDEARRDLSPEAVLDVQDELEGLKDFIAELREHFENIGINGRAFFETQTRAHLAHRKLFLKFGEGGEAGVRRIDEFLPGAKERMELLQFSRLTPEDLAQNAANEEAYP